MKSLYILTRAPDDPLTKPALDMIFSAAAFGEQPSIVFCQRAVELLRADCQSAGLPSLALLLDFEPGPCYVVLGPEHEFHCPRSTVLPVVAIATDDVKRLIDNTSSVQSF